MLRTLCLSSIVAIVPLGCSSPPAPPEVKAEPRDAPIAGDTKAQTDRPAPPTEPPRTEPPPPREPEMPWKNLPAGIVPPAKIGQISLASTDRPILARAAACDKPKLGDDCNYGGAEILGFFGDAVAVVYPPESGHPGVWPLVGELVGLDGNSRERKTITRTGELEDREYTAARLKGWKWFARLAKSGYAPAQPLVRATSVVEHGDTGHEPVAFLREPLDGWMLFVTMEKPGLGIKLVAPDNQKSHMLEVLPVPPGEKCLDEGGEPGHCSSPRRYELGSVRAVALDPTRTKLVVLLGLSYGTADEVHRTLWKVYPLPPDVLPAATP